MTETNPHVNGNYLIILDLILVQIAPFQTLFLIFINQTNNIKKVGRVTRQEGLLPPPYISPSTLLM